LLSDIDHTEADEQLLSPFNIYSQK